RLVAACHGGPRFIHQRLCPSHVVAIDDHPFCNKLSNGIFGGLKLAVGDPRLEPTLLFGRKGDIHWPNICLLQSLEHWLASPGWSAICTWIVSRSIQFLPSR